MEQRLSSERSAQDHVQNEPGIPAACSGSLSVQRFADSPRQVTQQQIRDGLQNAARQTAQRQRLETLQGGLPNALRSNMEAMSGIALDDVRVHRNSDRPAQLQALAYAQGNDIHLAPGQEQHLPHEAWHVVQQKQGRVKPTIEMKNGVGVNDDGGLEREADVMGRRAQATQRRMNGRRADQVREVSQGTVQRQAIKTAGLELEMKGALLSKGDDGNEDFGTHEKVMGNDDWWIEVDSGNPELVTDKTASQGQLFEWLKAGHAILKDIQVFAEKSAAVDALSEEDVREFTPNAKKAMDELSEICVKLDLSSVTARLNPGSEYMAKPQISFGLYKGQLANFVSSMMNDKIKHAEGYSKSKDDGYKKYNDEMWPRVSVEVAKIYNESPMWQTEKGKEFLATLSRASTEAKGLSMMTIITILFATRKQDPSDIWQYYKARFSVLPRVPLSELYDALEVGQKEEYKQLMDQWHDAVEQFNQGKEETAEGYHPTKIYRAQKDMSINIKQELVSIVVPGKRHTKTLEGRTKDVDLISSDAVASKSNVGASVGARDLPADSAGIYEIRTMPYINMLDYAAVERIYLETILAYGGMA